LVKSLIQSMARQSTSKCRHFGSRPSLTGHGSRAECDVKLKTRWFCISRIYLCLWKSGSKKLQVKCFWGACSNTTKLTWGIALDTTPWFHGEMMIVKKRNVRAAGHLDTSESEIRWSVLSISNQIISLDTGEERILQTSWLKLGEFGIVALWHRLMQPLLHLIWKREQSVSTADKICPLLIFKPYFWRQTG